MKDEPNEEMHEVEEKTTVDTVTTEKVDLPNQDADNTVSHLPVKEIRNVSDNSECVEAGTPSSFVPLKDGLGLSNWLPPEVCIIYRRKGISKLYPWQVATFGVWAHYGETLLISFLLNCCFYWPKISCL